MGTLSLGTRLEGRVLEALGEVRGRRVLDAGCGDGDLTRRLSALGADAWGLDRRGGGLRGDVRHLPFAGRSFDRAACVLVLHYLPSPREALGELARVLRPGGRLVLVDRVASAVAALRREQELLERQRYPAFGRLLSPPEIEEALREAGFDVDVRSAWEETVEVEAWTASAVLRERLRSLQGRDLGGLAVDGRLHLRLRLFGASLMAR